MAVVAPCAGKSIHDGVEERDLPMALRPGPRRNRNGRQETEENGPQNEKNEIDERSFLTLHSKIYIFMDAQGLYNSYIR